MSKADEFVRLHPAEARRLTVVGLIGLACLAPGVLRKNAGPSRAERPAPSCSRAAFWGEGRVNCETGSPLRPRQALWMGVQLDLNTVDAAALEVVPGIGPALSARIVEDRVLRGRFSGLAQVVRVRGVGLSTVERMRPFVTVRNAPFSRP